MLTAHSFLVSTRKIRKLRLEEYRGAITEAVDSQHCSKENTVFDCEYLNALRFQYYRDW